MSTTDTTEPAIEQERHARFVRGLTEMSDAAQALPTPLALRLLATSVTAVVFTYAEMALWEESLNARGYATTHWDHGRHRGLTVRFDGGHELRVQADVNDLEGRTPPQHGDDWSYPEGTAPATEATPEQAGAA